MICSRSDFILSIGADWFRAVIFADIVTGEPIPITGATAVLSIRKEVDGDLVGEISSGNGITITGASGRIDLRFTAAQTAAFDVTGIKQRTVTEYTTEGFVDIVADGYAAYYALEITYTNGVVERVIDGIMCLKPGGVE